MGTKRGKLRRAAARALQVMNPDESTNGADANQDEDDDELMRELMLKLDSRDQAVQAHSAAVLEEISLNKQVEMLDSNHTNGKQSAKARFQARQARKNAVLEKSLPPPDPNKDARLKREAEVEDKTIKRICEELDVRIHEVNPDGHCLYSAIADQLALLGIISTDQAHYAITRHAASEYIWNHPADFLPFLSGENDFATGVMSPRSFENYCAAIRDSAVWGGEPEILALSRAFNIPIHVVQGASPGVVVHNPRRAPEEGDAMNKGTKVVRISYHRRMYGLGEHYNSLRPKSKLPVINTLQTLLR